MRYTLEDARAPACDASRIVSDSQVENATSAFYTCTTMVPAPVLGVAKVSAVGLALSLIIFAYERALVPLYGSTPTNYLLHKIFLCTILLATISPIRISARKSILLSGFWMSIAPLGTYWLAVWTSRQWKEPVWGPAVTHLIILAPITYIAANLVRETEVSDSSANCSIIVK